jgi:N-acetylneuraminic acid mutarotase
MSKSVTLLLVLVFLTALCVVTIQPARASENSWITRPPMPKGEESLTSDVVNGKIYALGVDGTNQEYDPATLTWTTKMSMPTPMYGFGVAVYQNKIYVIGQIYNEVYDVATDTWTSKTSMPTWRVHMEANVVNDKIYLIGGVSDAELGTISNLNEVYDPASDTWTTKEPLPTPVSHYASAVVDNKICIIGGSGEPPNVINGQVQIYDPETDSWTLGKPMPTSVRSASAGATTGMFAPKRIYVIGGYQSSYGLNLNQVYDPQSDSWTLGAAMPTARYGLGVAVVNDTLYALGGVLLPPYAFPKVPLATNEVFLPFGYEGPLPPYWSPPPSPSPSPTTTPTPSPSTTPTPSPSPSPSEQPTETPEPQPKPFPIALVATASIVSAAVISLGLLVYFKKRKHQAEMTNRVK